VGYGPNTVQADERKRPAITDWVAVILSVVALAAAGYSTYRTNQAQEKANNIAQENVRLAEENINFQKQLQAQSQAAKARAAAQSVFITTVPPPGVAGQGSQGVAINNGARETITKVEVVFTNTAGGIVAVANIPVIDACDTVQLNFTDSYAPSGTYDAWLYFRDQSNRLWLTDLFGSFSEVNQEPTGADVTNELSITSGTVAQGTCDQ
jgi:hypothetical protein